LAKLGLGQVLDIVPNHMGVMGADNAWWLDVLENGRASAFAEFFDIDWQPLNPELAGKVLLPLLGDHYGAVLGRGELQLRFAPDRGEFSLFYYQHRLPIDPAAYPCIVGHRFASLATVLAGDPLLAELQSLLTAFGYLPCHDDAAPERIAERDRDKELHKRHLATLCSASPAIAGHIATNVAEFNGQPGDPGSFDLLHDLIKAQAWWLAYWRVASDDINYRRFFDINDLAALRMENPKVFQATHRLILSQLKAGHVQGLRIDHADGLYDPAVYFRRLQGRDGLPGTDRATNGQARTIYLVIEKILAEHERLPSDWPIHGGTGYRFANLVNGLFVDAGAESRMTRVYAQFIGQHLNFDDIVYAAKKLIVQWALNGELNVLAARLWRIAAASRHTCDFTLNSLRGALAEIVACFPVYRTYISNGHLSTEDRRHIDWAVAVARGRSPAADVSVFDFVGAVLTGDIAENKEGAYRDEVWRFAMKFQQYTAPVMAKGLEDTAFYRYHRRGSLPCRQSRGGRALAAHSAGGFHPRQQAFRRRPCPYRRAVGNPRRLEALAPSLGTNQQKQEAPGGRRAGSFRQRRVPALPDPVRYLALAGNRRRGPGRLC
jgi:(1->4)-alpha-D-glucan 1-alpha-D-glucosylmutase